MRLVGVAFSWKSVGFSAKYKTSAHIDNNKIVNFFISPISNASDNRKLGK